MCKVSVVIPVYNAEAYLCQCLDSVKAQTLQDIEVICINAIGFSGVLQSHIITTLFTGIICLLFLCMYGRNLKKERIKAIVFSGALTVLMNYPAAELRGI